MRGSVRFGAIESSVWSARALMTTAMVMSVSTPGVWAQGGGAQAMRAPGHSASSIGRTGSLAASPCEVASTLDFDIEGFGAATVGGWQTGHETVCVTSHADDGPGSLREACRSNGVPRVIGFAVDGPIMLNSPIDLPSNVSIDGRGHQIAVVGKGFWVHGVNNIIITHLSIEDVFPDSEDGIQIGFPDMMPAHDIVLDHMTFSQSGDGGNSAYVDEAMSVIYGAYNITVSWCRFVDWEKIMLFGNGDAAPEVDSNINVTVHHTFFDSTGRRHPQARYGIYDFYNNYLYDWHMYDRVGPPIWHESFGAQCEDDCQLLLENNIFERYWHADDKFSQANQASRCETGGEITERGHWEVPNSTVDLKFGVKCPMGSLARPYVAHIDDADDPLRQRLIQQAGNQ